MLTDLRHLLEAVLKMIALLLCSHLSPYNCFHIFIPGSCYHLVFLVFCIEHDAIYGNSWTCMLYLLRMTFEGFLKFWFSPHMVGLEMTNVTFENQTAGRGKDLFGWCTTKLQFVTSASCKLSHMQQVDCQSLVVSSSDGLVVLGIFLIRYFFYIFFIPRLRLIYSFFF